MRTYLFASSKPLGKEPYRTTVHDNGAVTCDCPARVECWHKKTVAERKPIGRTEFATVSAEDRRQALHLLSEGNESGAREFALELFPSMSVEETEMLLEEFRVQGVEDGWNEDHVDFL
jgi:hypothetical protein